MMSMMYVMYMFVDVHVCSPTQGWGGPVPYKGVAVHNSISCLFVVSWICVVFTVRDSVKETSLHRH